MRTPPPFEGAQSADHFEYRLGVFGEESGRYSESIFHLWSVCAKNQHVKLMSQHHEQYLGAQLGLLGVEDQEEWMQEPSLDKATMLRRFKHARDEMLRTHTENRLRNIGPALVYGYRL